MMTGRDTAYDIYLRLKENGITDGELVQYIVFHWLSGADARTVMQNFEEELY